MRYSPYVNKGFVYISVSKILNFIRQLFIFSGMVDFTGSGVRIVDADYGLRMRIVDADCGLRMRIVDADCGCGLRMRIADCEPMQIVYFFGKKPQ